MRLQNLRTIFSLVFILGSWSPCWAQWMAINETTGEPVSYFGTIDFGDVNIGEYKEITFRIANLDPSPTPADLVVFNIGEFSGSTPELSFPNPPLLPAFIQPFPFGGETFFTIRMTAINSGSVVAGINISSTDAMGEFIFFVSINGVSGGGATPQTITFPALAAKAYGNAPFALGATSSSGLPVSYSSSNTSVATVSGSTVTITGVGSTTITASQSGNSTYAAATPVAQSLTVTKANQTITFGTLADKTFGDAPFSLSSSSSSGLATTYVSSNTTVATVSGSTVTIVGVGSTTITASQSGNGNYNAAPSVNQTLTVNKANQTITFGTLPTKNVGDPNFTLNASSNSGLTISYSSSNASVATVTGNTVTIVGAGSTTITASQSGNSNYNAATSANQTLTVNSGTGTSQTITFSSLAPKNYGDSDFALSASASSGLTVSYSSSNTSVATVSGNTVTIVGAGSTIITASQPGDATYNAAPSVPQTLTVNKANQTITFGVLTAKTYGDVPFALSATSSSGLTTTYASSNTSVATVSGNTVTIVGAGSATITASQSGNSNYNAATSVNQTLTVNKVNQTITFGVLTAKTYGDVPFALSATSSSGLTTSYASSNTSVATVSGNTVTIVGAGSATITASQSGNGNYNAAPSVNQSLTVNKANQTLTFGSLPVKNVGDANFALNAASSSGLVVTYTSSNTSVASVTGNIVTIIGGGTTTITASQGGNINYNSASSVNQMLTVNSIIPQTITFSALAPKKYNDASFNLTATSSSGLAVSYSNSNPSVATISGNTVTITGVGTTTITASQSGNTTYSAAAPVSQTLIVNRAEQTITFGALASKFLGDASFSLQAFASSGLPVGYVSSNNAVATINGNVVTIVGVGSAFISASQSGNLNYNPAISVGQTLIVTKANQTITFASIMATKNVGDSFTVEATASSGLPVNFICSNASVANIVGNTINVVGGGSATITAIQSGNTYYNAASPVSQTFSVNRINQVITFSPIADKVQGGSPFTVTATSTSNLPVSFSTLTPGLISISNNSVSILRPGRASVTASQAGNNGYNAAIQITQSFCITPSKPVLTSKQNNTTYPLLTSSSSTGNQWYKNGQLIEGSTLSTYQVTSDGVYSVKIFFDDCISAPSDNVSIVVTGDLETTNPLSEIYIYPNPAEHDILVRLPEAGVNQISIIDGAGIMRDQTLRTDKEFNLDINHLASGLYMLRVESDSKTYSVRFMKK